MQWLDGEENSVGTIMIAAANTGASEKEVDNATHMTLSYQSSW